MSRDTLDINGKQPSQVCDRPNSVILEPKWEELFLIIQLRTTF